MVPGWAYEDCRFLRRPWFIGTDPEKAILLAESPSAFRQRFIFIEAEPLRRPRMPKDDRWWAYETLRSGLLPPTPEQKAADEADPRRWRQPGRQGGPLGSEITMRLVGFVPLGRSQQRLLVKVGRG